jgi:hypothetical protein
MKPSEPMPVKLVCGVLYSEESFFEQALRQMCALYGRVDFKSPLYPFVITDYYVEEMGATICRQIISFDDLINPGKLAQIKINCNAIEDELALNGQRKVNLDPGYLDYDKFVLGSAKYNSHKIYLDLGIYADLTMRYERGAYIPSSYAFPDFKSGQYNDAFLSIRARYKGQLRRFLNQDKID